GYYRRRGCGRIGAKAQSQELDLRPGRESYQSFSTSFFSPLSESHDHRQFGHGGDELRRQTLIASLQIRATYSINRIRLITLISLSRFINIHLRRLKLE